MSISHRLYYICSLFFLVFCVSIYGLLQVAKGADFHRFNVHHHDGSLNMYLLIQAFDKGDFDKLDALEKEIKYIRQQPVDCINEVNVIDIFVMKIINTLEAYDLCIRDLEVGNKILQDIEDFRQQKISAATLISNAYTAQEKFIKHSQEFVEPVAKTVSFIIAAMITILVSVSLLVAVALGFIIRSIARTEDKLRNYSRMLEKKTNEAESTLKQAEEANDLKNQFLATMSHEIRTPMNGIFGMAELMMESELNYKQEYQLSTLMASADSLLTIIDDVLDFSKIESGKLELNPIGMDLHLLVENIAELFSLKGLEKSVEVILYCKPHVPHYVVGDPVRIRQIISNIIGNAIKFTEKGYVFIEVDIDESASAQINNNCVVYKISIADTGIGIELNMIDKVFTKFSQADGSTTRKSGGTGIGLSICKSLLDMVNGSITLESELGKGSNVVITLPLQVIDKPAMINGAVPHSMPSFKGVRLLVVDDVELNGIILKEHLKATNIDCDYCISGQQALVMMRDACARNRPYHIAIIDYIMPAMNGIELAKRIRESPEYKEILLIMISSSGSKGYGKEFADIDFDAYLAKPLRSDRLVFVLERVWKASLEANKGGISKPDNNKTIKKVTKDKTITFKQAKILLAEDNRVNQAAVEEILKNLECEVDIATNGQEAIQWLEKQEYDLVLMDCQMPIMDGFEASQRACVMKIQGRMLDTPIVALTANAMKGDRERCILAGMQDYLAKPIRTDGLIDILIRWLPEEKIQGYKYTDIISIESESRKLKNVLLVEDNRINCMMAEDLLESLDCNVDVAENGKIAIDKVLKKPYDIIFMDCQMPIMDGYQASRCIDDMRKTNTISNVPIVALTANTLQNDRQKCVESGMDDFIAKPVKKKSLEKILIKWVA